MKKQLTNPTKCQTTSSNGLAYTSPRSDSTTHAPPPSLRTAPMICVRNGALRGGSIGDIERIRFWRAVICVVHFHFSHSPKALENHFTSFWTTHVLTTPWETEQFLFMFGPEVRDHDSQNQLF